MVRAESSAVFLLPGAQIAVVGLLGLLAKKAGHCTLFKSRAENIFKAKLCDGLCFRRKLCQDPTHISAHAFLKVCISNALNYVANKELG